MLETHVFVAGPEGAPLLKTWGQNRNPVTQTCIYIEGGRKMGGLLGPRPQKPGGHLENLGANGPWAPVSFEPWNCTVYLFVVLCVLVLTVVFCI